MQKANIDALHRIEAALERLNKGQFGFCMQCKREIDLERLVEDPLKTLCTLCESKGAITHAPQGNKKT